MKTSSSSTGSSWATPAEVVERALAARDEALRLAQARAFPFDYETQISTPSGANRRPTERRALIAQN